MGFSTKPRAAAPTTKKEYLPIPNGLHKVAIIESTYEQDERSSRFQVTFQIDDESSDFNKQRVWGRYIVASDVLSPKAVEIGQEQLDALLFAVELEVEEAPQTFEDRSYLASALIGKELFVETKQREYNDKTYVDPKKYFTLEGESINGEAMPSKAVKKVTVQAKSKPKFGG